MIALAVTLALNTVNKFVCMTLWLMMLHYHTDLVTKCFVVQKISSGQTFTIILNLCCDLDLECSNTIFSQGTLAYEAILSSLVTNGLAV